MARIARVVVPGIPHHITQRGVRRMAVFFSDDDRHAYIELLAEQGERFGLQYLAWCLMSNHVHLIGVPETETSLAKGVGEAHKRYTRMVNFREGAKIELCEQLASYSAGLSSPAICSRGGSSHVPSNHLN